MATNMKLSEITMQQKGLERHPYVIDRNND